MEPGREDAEKARESPGELAATLPLGDSSLPGAWKAAQVGPYQPLGLLGEGSMGQVWRARHTLLGRQVALKVMRPEHAQCRELVARFFQEARAVNEIDHAHIVEVFDFLEEPRSGLACCVMELLEGESLAALLRRGPLGLRRALPIARQVCEALAAAHRRGVVHRDIKPDNIFVTQRPEAPDFVKVLDFGVAKLLAPLGGAPVARTLAGAIVGTPSYMAPEQASGLPVDQRADIYAVGVVLYQLVSGRLPFEAQTFGQLSAQLLTRPAPPLGRVASSGEPVPPELQQLVMRCLEKDPERRPGSMDELAAALSRLGEGGGRRAAPRNGPLWALTALALAASASWGLWAPWLFSGGPTAASVRLQVASHPPGARVVRLDTGQPLGLTPLAARLPRADRPLAVRLELEGHEPVERSVRLDADVGLEVALQPARSLFPPVERVTRDGVIDPYAR